MKLSVLSAAALAAALSLSPARPTATAATAQPIICAACVQATMQTLAGDELHGRKCGTPDENAAARYLAEAMRKAGIKGGLPDGGYLQPVELLTPTYAAPPTLELTAPGGASLRLVAGEGMVIQGAPPERFDAPVVRVPDAAQPVEGVQGKLVIFEGGPSPAGAGALQKAGAAAVILAAPDQVLGRWAELAGRPPGRTEVVGGVVRNPPAPLGPLIFVRPETLAALAPFGGGQARLSTRRGQSLARTTYNVIGVRHGKAAEADRQAVLLTAHYDHLGVRGGVTFHGADDDASGTAAVIEFARLFGRGPAHRRSVSFALFGCEEEGGLGAQYFLTHQPPALQIAANLEFEMIGVDDPKRPGFLMLTGWERSNLGPTLAAHGARIAPDPYPEQHFFQRSDNYQLAQEGVVAQTVSAWPIPPTYHAASDDLAHVDLAFMDTVIGSLVAPVAWLLDSDFEPAWNPGQRP